jgi:hypothetical protein
MLENSKIVFKLEKMIERRPMLDLDGGTNSTTRQVHQEIST